MKKSKVILSVFALVLAIGGTFATQVNSSVDDHYRFINGPDEDICQVVTSSPCGSGQTACTISGDPVGTLNQPSSQCGTQLKMQP